MVNVQEELQKIGDPVYAAFSAKLAPTVPRDRFLGVRVPALREYAKSFQKSPECETFLRELPHAYYDENLLHSILLETTKRYTDALFMTEAFLPFVDNWAVCDTLRPKVFAKHKEELFPHLEIWIASPKTYSCRFGLDMLMTHYLDEDFKPEYPALAASPKSEEYYVRMMVAWYFATALAKQWDATIPYLEKRILPKWTHQKAIQKAKESYRISPEQKAYLETLK